jgi:hypothetical protein
MKIQNLDSQPLLKMYRATVFCALGVTAVGASLIGVWSISCLGSAFIELLVRI